MYDLNQVGESTFYMDSPANVGFYVDENRVFLIDGGSDKDAAKKALKHIESRGWTLEAVICTHSHADHAGGCALLRQKKDALYLPYEQPVTWETIRQVIKEALREES